MENQLTKKYKIILTRGEDILLSEEEYNSIKRTIQECSGEIIELKDGTIFNLKYLVKMSIDLTSMTISDELKYKKLTKTNATRNLKESPRNIE